MLQQCITSLKQFSSTSTRGIFTSSTLSNRYKQWPPENIRRIGRRPSYWTGQGGKRSRIAYDKRYPLCGKDINTTTVGLRRGGSDFMCKSIGEESECERNTNSSSNNTNSINNTNSMVSFCSVVVNVII